MAAPLLIRDGTLIDGTGAPARPGSSVLLRGDEIAAVGATADVSAALEADERPEVIDAAGATILPGLIDAHCHITFGEPASNDELFFHREPAFDRDPRRLATCRSCCAPASPASSTPTASSTSARRCATRSTPGSSRALGWRPG